MKITATTAGTAVGAAARLTWKAALLYFIFKHAHWSVFALALWMTIDSELLPISIRLLNNKITSVHAVVTELAKGHVRVVDQIIALVKELR